MGKHRSWLKGDKPSWFSAFVELTEPGEKGWERQGPGIMQVPVAIGMARGGHLCCSHKSSFRAG